METIFIQREKGQALITLLVLMVVAITVTAAAVVSLLTGALSSSGYERGTDAFSASESGIENAILRLLRTPSYLGETLTVGDATVAVQITPGNPITIVSTATASGNSVRKIQAAVNGGKIATVSSWKESF